MIFMISKPKPKSRDNILEEEEIINFIDFAKSYREKLLCCGLAFTGMRISEFLHLNRDWINFEKGYISIPSSMKCKCFECAYKGGVWKPKTKEAIRKIPILPEIKDMLKKYFSKHQSIMEIIPSRVVAWQTIKEVGARAGIKHPVFPHAIRATFASILAEKDFSSATITRIMGWRSMKTADEYIKVSTSKVMRETLEKW